MSGAEPVVVLGLVCAIVSAFTGAAALLQQRKAKNQEQSRQAEQEAVEQSLVDGAPSVQRQYDYGFARLGERFKRGDSMSLHCCSHHSYAISQLFGKSSRHRG